MKTIEKMTKQDMINYLGSASVQDTNLMERIKYSLDMAKKDLTKVLKTDLAELVVEVKSLLTPADGDDTAPVEAHLKPKKKTKLTGKSKEEPKEDEEEQEDKPKAKKSVKKTTKKEEKGADIETVPPVSTKGTESLPSAKVFPETIDHPDLGKLVSCAGHYHTYKEILQAIEEEKTLYFACYWTKSQIKKYQYAETYSVLAPKKGFPLDLDMLMAVLPCETMERVYAMSRFTEALFQFEGEDFTPIEDVDPRSGKPFAIRVSSGMEFEVYRPEDEEVTVIEAEDNDQEEDQDEE